MVRLLRCLTLLAIPVVTFWFSGMALAQQASVKPIEGPGSTLSQQARVRIPHTPKIPYGLPLMARFDLLPLLRDTRCVQDSSYDRSGGNGDSGHFLRKEGNKAILADIRGPGCIYRFWSANAAGHLKIFFDGEKDPRVDCPMQDLFLAKYAPFVSPLVGHKSGGWYCFFPMPFQKSCRIEVTDPGNMYYHVQYQLFSDHTRVHTFTRELSKNDAAALSTILRQLGKLGEDPKPDAEKDQEKQGTLALGSGESRELVSLAGPGEVNALRMKVSPADRLTLRQTVLKVYWDGAEKPGIEAPLGDFFGVGFGDQRFRAMPDAMTDQGYVCYWPMPFARSARFELTNDGKTPLADVSWSVRVRPLRRSLRDAGYFHAQWHRQTTVSGEHFHILHTTGRGLYVGEHTEMQGDHGIGFLEGDEKFTVDDDTFPSIHGTGTEDFYTGGWYFDEGPFSLAYHGCTVKNDSMSRVAAYRYQIQDCVPFQREIKVDIEHGGTNDYPGADYACVAYWYQDSPGHDWSPIDVSQLTPAVYKVSGALEAESLTWTGGHTEVVEDLALGTEASGGKAMRVSGERPTFHVSVKNEDVYRLKLAQILSSDSPLALGLIVDPEDAANRTELKFLSPSKTGEAQSVEGIRLKPGDHTFAMVFPAEKKVTLDYVQLEASHKEKGAIEAESLLEKAQVSDPGQLRRIDGPLQYSGYSVLEWKSPGADAVLGLPVSVAIEGSYALELGLDGAMGLTVTARLDQGTPITVDTSKLPGKNAVRRVRFGDVRHLSAGAHTLHLSYTVASPAEVSVGLRLDYIRLIKSLYPHTVEAESLRVVDSKDGEATHQEMGGFGPNWSNDDQFWLIGDKQGAEATLELPVSSAGHYNLAVYYTTAKDYAIVQVLLDGKEIGPATDCYTEKVLAKGRTSLGTVDLTAGMHRLTFRAVGKNPASTNYLIGVDAIGLEPTP